MPSRHRKEHHSHETTDAFAEGWDAHIAAGATSVAENPYRSRLAAIAQAGLRVPARKIDSLERDADLWDQGWAEQAEVDKDERAGRL